MDEKTAKTLVLKMSCTPKWGCTGDTAVSDDELIETLLNSDGLEWTDSEGRDLLINAVIYERDIIVEFLLNQGTNVNITDKNGFSPLHFAVQSGNLGITNILLKFDPNVNIKNAFGNSPIMMATLNFPLEGFEALLKNGADPHQKNNYGVSAKDIFSAYPEIVGLFDIQR